MAEVRHESSGSSLENQERGGNWSAGNREDLLKEERLTLAPGEVKNYMDVGFASVYLKGTEYGMPIMIVEAADVEVTHEALEKALSAISSVLRERVDFAICYDLRNMRRPAMSDSRTIINWMNDEELSVLLCKHAMITCVMVGNTWAGMAISGGTKLIQGLCSAKKPTAVVYTEEEREKFLKSSILNFMASKCDSRSTADE
ncbi:unnamed protein product [Effrenium voratum]|uniref:Uncharacterized protein n=1 Tax=Effrenium voratum TaxID=2562239 RepID=A0AA36N2N5_9DINO|nr:unnamed protein product [Effrenium voratum]CAJ1396320.1 unnamed protein product [Effrenium voratum]CAJ1442474.1 unnamed protein product [Effrenium voratum]